MPANEEPQKTDTTPDDTTPDDTTPDVATSDDAPKEPAAEPAATRPRRQVWRCSKLGLTVAIAFMVVTGLAIPGAAFYAFLSGYTAFGDQHVLVLGILVGIAVLALILGWRFVLHPRIKLVDDVVRVINPFHTRRMHLDDITVFRPDPNGLIIGTADDEVRAWCVQKSGRAIKHDQRTRSDQICDELWAIWEDYHRPTDQGDGSIRLRYARAGEAKLLTDLERSANLAQLGHIFPADEFPYPDAEIEQRWQQALDDKVKLIMIAEIDGKPAGYVCFGDRTIFHLGVAEEHQRKGVGTSLLTAAEEELMADVSVPDIVLWVLEENNVARQLYSKHGWEETDEVRRSEFAPHPQELMMYRDNPHRARRGR